MGVAFLYCMRVVFFVFYSLFCNGSLNNNPTLTMQNIDFTQEITAQLRSNK